MRPLNKVLISLLLTLAFAPLGWTVPLLQLDVDNGVYIGAPDSSTHATDDPFTLVALYTNGSAPTGSYYISAAIVPKVGATPTGSPTANFGSFSIAINGTTATYSAAQDMQYGGPPVDDYDVYPNLPTHGIYATWFAEVGFTFNPANTMPAYDVQTGELKANSLSLYQNFTVDTSGLANGFAVHFDLYNEWVHQKKKATDYNLEFAPFSHDAQSRTRVPDSASTFSLLAGVLALCGWVRSRRG